MDGRMDGRMDRRTDRWFDSQAVDLHIFAPRICQFAIFIKRHQNIFLDCLSVVDDIVCKQTGNKAYHGISFVNN